MFALTRFSGSVLVYRAIDDQSVSLGRISQFRVPITSRYGRSNARPTGVRLLLL